MSRVYQYKIERARTRACVSTGRPRPIVPPDFRRTVFNVVHNLSHPGVKVTVKMVSDKFVWHGMRNQVSGWVKECHHCQSSKIQNHTKAPLEHFSVPGKRFSHINIDIVGPLPFSSGFTYLLTIIDRNTRWPEAIPLRGITTPECVHALITGWIARFGVPVDISSDRGSQFTLSLWSEIAARLGVKFHYTSAYHPQANGMIDRFHRTLKTALKARLTGPNWLELLPWVPLGLRTTPKEDLGYSSAELVFGERLTIPGELVPPKSAKSMDDLLLNFRLNIPLYAPRPASHHTSARPYLSPSLLAAKHVYVRRDGTKGPLQRPYSGPYAVLTPGDKTFLIDIDGRAERISVDRSQRFSIHFNRSYWLNLLHVVALQPNRVIPHAVIHQTHAPPLGISKLCGALLFRRHRVQVALFDRQCDTSHSYGVSLWGGGGGGGCGVWTTIKTNP